MVPVMYYKIVRSYLLSRRKSKPLARKFYLPTKGILKRGNKSTQTRIYMGEKHKVDGNCCKAQRGDGDGVKVHLVHVDIELRDGMIRNVMQLLVVGIDEVVMWMVLGIPLLGTTGDGEHVMFASFAFKRRGSQTSWFAAYNRSSRFERWGEGHSWDDQGGQDNNSKDKRSHCYFV